MVPQEVVDGYIESSQIHTNGPKKLKYGLKWSQESTFDDAWCAQTNVFGERVSKLWLSAENDTPIGNERVWNPFLNQN